MNLAALLELLRASRFDLATEGRVQSDVQAVLASSLDRSAWEREPRLSARDRPDFMVQLDGAFRTVAIEVKASRQRAPAILAQLGRYAEHDEVEGLILLTNTAINLPMVVGGKPAWQVSLGRAWL